MSGGKQRLYLMCFHKHHQLHMGFRWGFGLDRVGKGALDGYSGWAGFDGESMENKCKISDGNWLLNSHFHSKFISFLIILLQMHHVPIAESVEWLLMMSDWPWNYGDRRCNYCAQKKKKVVFRLKATTIFPKPDLKYYRDDGFMIHITLYLLLLLLLLFSCVGL